MGKTKGCEDAFDGHLSPRQKECLEWVARGKSNAEIAIIVGISRHTVDFHLREVMAKMRVSSRVGAVAKALAADLIELTARKS